MRVLAAVDDSPARLGVRRVAEALARLLGVEVDVVTVIEAEEPLPTNTVRRERGTPIERLAVELGDPDVLLGVLGARRLPGSRHPTGHVVTALIERAPCPIVVVPPGDRPVRPPRRILVPVEGAEVPDGALGRALSPFAEAGVGIVSVHVFTESTTPSFWEGWNDSELWCAEFCARHAPRGAALELRTGDVCTEIIDAAADLDTDLVAVEWSQDLSLGHARVIRTLLDRLPMPVLLVPARGRREEIRGPR